ncbi:MAG: Hsp20 family protein [Alphaproteobacteria bacterium]|nr:Hsp20 family protein [Alphaproteobacteria bacterium]
MITYDFSPLYRSTVGFDRLARLFDAAMTSDPTGFPPYNIEVAGEDGYRITMALAGFSENEIAVVQQGNELVVSGSAKNDGENRQYLYRGIAGRSFERRFQLADHVKVSEAQMENGLLRIDLVREVPEALRPRKIEIGKAGSVGLLKKAA